MSESNPNTPPLLAGLDQLNWSKTWDAYGKAKKVPGHLRALASADPATQDAAFDELSYTIYHQGSVYPAATEAVPFLLEILRSPRVVRKAPVLELMELLAGGQSYVDNHEGLTLFDGAVKRDAAFAARLEAERRDVPELHRRIRDGLATYLALLRDGPPLTRLRAASLMLALGPQSARQTVPALASAAVDDADPAVRAAALVAAVRLDAGAAEPLLRQRAEADADALPRAAALAWVTALAPDGATGHDVEALHAMLADPGSDVRARYEELPCVNRFDDDLAVALGAVGPEHARPALDVLAGRLRDAKYLMDNTMATLLHLARRAEGDFEPGAPLKPAQATAVRVVADAAWERGHIWMNAVEVLGAFGLPQDRRAVRRLLGEDPGAPPAAAAARAKRWYEFWK